MADALEALVGDSNALLIPSGGAAYGNRRMTLDDRVYTLKLAWNSRHESWYFDLYDSESLPIAAGVRIVTNWPLLRYKRWDPRCPPGELMAVDETGSKVPPAFDDFGIGKRVQLTYFSING